MSARDLHVRIPPEIADAIAERAAAIVEERLAAAASASPYLTAAEAAEYLRWPKKRLYNLTAAKAIPHRRHEGRVLFRRDELDAWLDGLTEGPAVPLRCGRRGARR